MMSDGLDIIQGQIFSCNFYFLFAVLVIKNDKSSII